MSKKEFGEDAEGVTMEAMGLLREISDAAPTATWKRVESGRGLASIDPTVGVIEGQAGEWRLSLISFSLERQGAPKGTRGYDGVAVGRVILRLPREFATKLFALAEKALSEPGG